MRALRAVAERPDPTLPMSVGEIARELGVALSTASRLCSELQAASVLERCAPHGTYRIGPRAVALSGRSAAPFARTVRYALTLAAQQTGETACLAAGPPEDMRIVAAVESVWTLFAPADIGDRVDPESPLARAAHPAQKPGKHEADVGMSIEVAAPVLGPHGHPVATIAIRVSANRARQNLPRARHAVESARRAVERSIVPSAPTEPPEGPRPSPVSRSALEATLDILEHLAEAPGTTAEVGRAVRIRADRAQRLLESCLASGVVTRDQGTVWAVDWRVHGWYRAAVTSTLVERGGPPVSAAAEATGLCAFITTLKGMRSFTIVEELAPAGAALRMASWLGRPCALMESDGGPTLAMDFSDSELTRLFPGRLPPEEVAAFAQRARSVERSGVLLLDYIEESGFLSLSAPVRDAAGCVVAAVCIVGPPREVRPRLAELKEVTRRLGAQVSATLNPVRDSPAPRGDARVGRRT